MSILVKGMKMPPTCRHCDFKRIGQFGGEWCALTKSDIPRKPIERLEDCPLIDTDDLIQVSIVDKINDNGKIEVVRTIFLKDLAKFYEVEE